MTKPTRALFCVLGSPGFLGTGIGIALELNRRDVPCCIVTDAGAKAWMPREAAPVFRGHASGFRVDSWGDDLSLVAQHAATQDAIDEFKPTVLIADQFAFGSIIAARSRGIRLAVVNLGPFLLPIRNESRDAVPTHFPALIGQYNRVCALVGSPAVSSNFDDRCPLLGDLFLFRSIPELGLGPSKVPRQTTYIGDALFPFDEPPDDPLQAFMQISDERLFYVHVPKLFSNAALLPKLVEAAECSNLRFVLACPRGSLDGASERILVRERVAFGAVLPHVAGVVSLGHTAPVYAALRHGLPNLILDVGSGGREMADRCEYAGVGITIAPRSGEGATKLLYNGLQRLVEDTTLRRNAARLSRIFLALDGFKVAADVITLRPGGHNEH